MKIELLKDWGPGLEKPLMIAGPCSAETEEQLYETALSIREHGIKVIRAGIWKPRTRPNHFEGIGLEALKWIQNIKKETGLLFAIEVANPKHVYEAIKHNVDILWIGARSTTNPFTVQEIAEAVRGADVPVLVKNPINPDLALWLGAIERISNVGITKIGAIHRGFSSFKQTKLRNMPMWQIALDLKSTLNNIPLICDPSHICGRREYIFDISQKAIDLDYDGLIIETHRDPENAWSDAAQQITPEMLGSMLRNLKYRKSTSEDRDFIVHLEEMRAQIDHTDKELFEIISQRMAIVDQIGKFKRKNNVTVFQKSRWQEISDSRRKWSEELGLNQEFMHDLFKLIHDASIRRQEEIMNTPSPEEDDTAN
jgi:chorismate mutase